MSNTVKCLLLIAFIAAVAGLYFIFDPSQYVWFPKCVFHQLTGLECPACGSQRAIHAALHGDVLDALQINPFIIISVPYGLGLVLILIFKTPFTARLRARLLHPYVVYTYCFIFVGWWILRNLI